MIAEQKTHLQTVPGLGEPSTKSFQIPTDLHLDPANGIKHTQQYGRFIGLRDCFPRYSTVHIKQYDVCGAGGPVGWGSWASRGRHCPSLQSPL
jgi:hypothetical protein